MRSRLLPEPGLRSRIAALVWARRLFWLPASGAFLWWRAGAAFWVTLVLSLMLAGALKAREESLRRQFVREAALPRFLLAKLRAAYPQLQPRDAELVLHGLRQFFLAHLRSGRKFVAMPSRIVDVAWHEFILHTRGYQYWCTAAFGGLMHHSPAAVLGRDTRRNDGLRRSWYWACKEESIDPRRPSRLPLLFALDAKFAVPGGFAYVPDCHAADRHDGSGAHCGSEFGDSNEAAAGDAEGFGGSESSTDGASSGDGGGSGDSDGSGCGGD